MISKLCATGPKDENFNGKKDWFLLRGISRRSEPVQSETYVATIKGVVIIFFACAKLSYNRIQRVRCLSHCVSVFYSDFTCFTNPKYNYTIT